MTLIFKPQQSKILVSLVKDPKLYVGELPVLSNNDVKKLCITLNAESLDGPNFSSKLPKGIDYKRFQENRAFRLLLNNVIDKSIQNSPAHQALAAYLKNGNLHINDLRVPEQWGRVNDPEDIFGSVLVQDGKIKVGTFEPMFTHRLLSSNGIFKLDSFLLDKLLKH